MLTLYCFVFLSSAVLNVLAVPPAICRAPFRWDDCGKPAKAVMYYWKEGSRCEIGFWKGCLPNPNMFADEYECINTCIFVDRPSVRVETEETETEANIVQNTTDGNSTHGNLTLGEGHEETGETHGENEATNEGGATEASTAETGDAEGSTTESSTGESSTDETTEHSSSAAAE